MRAIDRILVQGPYNALRSEAAQLLVNKIGTELSCGDVYVLRWDIPLQLLNDKMKP